MRRHVSVIHRRTCLKFTCSEDVSAGIAAQSEVVVVAVRAVGLLILARERSIDQRHLAVDALETVLMPVLLLVRQILQEPSHLRIAAVPQQKNFKP